MKKLLAYTFLTLIILAIIFGFGAEPKPETTIIGFMIFKASFALIVITLIKVFKGLKLYKYLGSHE